MKKKFVFMLLAAAMVFGFTGCGEDDNGSGGFDYTPWVGEWKIVGAPHPQGTITAGNDRYIFFGAGNAPGDFAFLNTWELEVTSKGLFIYRGILLDLDTSATGQLNNDKEEPNSFRITPVDGYWDKGKPEQAAIPDSTLAMFVGYINRVLQDDGKWIMYGMEMFNFVWEKQ